jgi:phosphatidylethanolamine/phosphatidyl-N-methylethanolamine N-methyltransferase
MRMAGNDREDPDALVRDWYAHHYSRVSASGADSSFARFMHRAIEKPYDSNHVFERVLEVGANRGEHVPFVLHSFGDYIVSDLHVTDLLPEVEGDVRVTAASCDVGDLPYADSSFDRVLATCLMHHVESPFRAAQEMRRVVRSGGLVTILVPTDPGLAYRWGKALTSGRAARRYGLAESQRLVSALDHRNHFLSIRTQLHHVFREDTVRMDWHPLRVPFMNANAFVVFRVTTSPT